jgi:hypothetical protein
MAQTRVGVRLRPTLWNGLLAYYTGDNTPNDILGNYNGTPINGVTCGDGVIKKGFKFDGVNDYLEISPVIPYNSTSDSFSFSAWINPTKNGTIIDNFNAGNLTGINIWLSGGRVYVRIASGPYPQEIRTYTTNTITYNNLYHLVVTYDGSTDSSGVNIYIDSSNQARGTQFNNCVSASLNNNRTRLSSGYFGITGGIMDEIGVWNRVISQSEVTDLYNSGNAKQHPTLTGIDPFWNEAIAYYTGNDTTYDSVGYFNGTLVNGASYANDGIIYDDEGNVDKSFSIDRSLLQNVTTTSPPHNYATETTYNMWVKPSSLPGFCMFLYIPTGITGPGIGLRPGGDLTLFRGNVNGDAKSGVYLVTDVWQMVTIVYRPWAGYGTNNVDFYINGSLVASKPLSISSVGGYNMYIGSNGAGNGVYDGLIDEVSIWNTDLSPSKITELYNSGSGKQFPN